MSSESLKFFVDFIFLTRGIYEVVAMRRSVSSSCVDG